MAIFRDFKCLGIFIIFTSYGCFTGERVHEDANTTVPEMRSQVWSFGNRSWMLILCYKAEFWKQEHISCSVGNIERAPFGGAERYQRFWGKTLESKVKTWGICKSLMMNLAGPFHIQCSYFFQGEMKRSTSMFSTTGLSELHWKVLFHNRERPSHMLPLLRLYHFYSNVSFKNIFSWLSAKSKWSSSSLCVRNNLSYTLEIPPAVKNRKLMLNTSLLHCVK